MPPFGSAKEKLYENRYLYITTSPPCVCLLSVSGVSDDPLQPYLHPKHLPQLSYLSTFYHLNKVTYLYVLGLTIFSSWEQNYQHTWIYRPMEVGAYSILVASPMLDWIGLLDCYKAWQLLSVYHYDQRLRQGRVSCCGLISLYSRTELLIASLVRRSMDLSSCTPPPRYQCCNKHGIWYYK